MHTAAVAVAADNVSLAEAEQGDQPSTIIGYSSWLTAPPVDSPLERSILAMQQLQGPPDGSVRLCGPQIVHKRFNSTPVLSAHLTVFPVRFGSTQKVHALWSDLVSKVDPQGPVAELLVVHLPSWGEAGSEGIAELILWSTDEPGSLSDLIDQQQGDYFTKAAAELFAEDIGSCLLDATGQSCFTCYFDGQGPLL